MGRVEFGCNVNDEKTEFIPTIAIESGGKIVIFRADIILSSSDDAKDFITAVSKIMTGPKYDREYHPEGKESEIQKEDRKLEVVKETPQ